MSEKIDSARCQHPIVVVSGLPRSGTSMMMGMLEAGGVPLLVDGRRIADADNPRGYYEYEPAARLAGDAPWLSEAVGTAVKVISFHLFALPPHYRYQVLFMDRALPEVLASQQCMIARHGGAPGSDRGDLGELYKRHLRHVREWLDKQPNMDVLFVRHEETLAQPRLQAQGIAAFLRRDLDLDAMANAVDPALYRQRS